MGRGSYRTGQVNRKNAAAVHPSIQNPPPPRRQRGGGGSRRYSTKTPRPFTCSARDLIKTLGTNAPRQQQRPGPRATQHKRSRITGILPRFTDVNELLLSKASLNAFIPSSPMPLPAHEQWHRREPAGNTISGQCCGTTPFTAPHPNTSTAAPTAGPASSSSNPNAQTKTVGTSKICPWVCATDPVKVCSTASLLPSCASPCTCAEAGGRGCWMATGSALVLLLLLPFQKATAFVSEVRKRLTASQLVTHGPISVFTPTVLPVFNLPPTCM